MSMIMQDSPIPAAKTLQDKLESLFMRRRHTKGARKEMHPAFTDLLEKLGNPHQKLPPVIHVAGTNGKGSVIAYMKAILESAGYRVHCYTSPHLIRFNERIVLAGQEIEDGYLEELLNRILAVEEEPLDFFEITTALAFAAFSETPADILLLETGLGGRLDCTNVIKAPIATVITSISYDHMEVLGNKLSDIAYEKSGIFKENSPCYIGQQGSEEVIEVLRDRATRLNCPVFQCGQEWELSVEKENFVFNQRHCCKESYPLPSLKGGHQIDNAGLAVAVLKNSSTITVTGQDIESGLRKAKWPGRLQKLDSNNIPDNWEVWLDSGHNEGAGQILADQAAWWRDQDNIPLHLIVAMMKRKDAEGFLRPVMPYLSSFTALPMPDNSSGGIIPDTLYHIAQRYSVKEVGMAHSYDEAIYRLFEGRKQDEVKYRKGRIMVTGSVRLAGYILSKYKT